MLRDTITGLIHVLFTMLSRTSLLQIGIFVLMYYKVYILLMRELWQRQSVCQVFTVYQMLNKCLLGVNNVEVQGTLRGSISQMRE